MSTSGGCLRKRATNLSATSSHCIEQRGKGTTKTFRGEARVRLKSCSPSGSPNDPSIHAVSWGAHSSHGSRKMSLTKESSGSISGQWRPCEDARLQTTFRFASARAAARGATGLGQEGPSVIARKRCSDPAKPGRLAITAIHLSRRLSLDSQQRTHPKGGHEGLRRPHKGKEKVVPCEQPPACFARPRA